MAEQKKKRNPLRDSVNIDSSDEDDFNTSTNKKDSSIEPERPSEHSVE